MTPIQIDLRHVNYNAATQAFEALAILHDNGAQHTYACSIDAPITLAFDDAAGRLSRQAFRLHRIAGHMRRSARRDVARPMNSVVADLPLAA